METEPRGTWTIKHTLNHWWHASFYTDSQGHSGYGGKAVKREWRFYDLLINRTLCWPLAWPPPPSPAWTGGWWEEGTSACDGRAARGTRGRASAALKLGHVTGWWKQQRDTQSRNKVTAWRGDRNTEALQVTEISSFLMSSAIEVQRKGFFSVSAVVSRAGQVNLGFFWLLFHISGCTVLKYRTVIVNCNNFPQI